MDTVKANTQEMPKNMEKRNIFEKQILCDGDLLIRDIESNQNEGTVVNTRYGQAGGKYECVSWKNVPGNMI